MRLIDSEINYFKRLIGVIEVANSHQLVFLSIVRGIWWYFCNYFNSIIVWVSLRLSMKRINVRNQKTSQSREAMQRKFSLEGNSKINGFSSLFTRENRSIAHKSRINLSSWHLLLRFPNGYDTKYTSNNGNYCGKKLTSSSTSNQSINFNRSFNKDEILSGLQGNLQTNFIRKTDSMSVKVCLFTLQ